MHNNDRPLMPEDQYRHFRFLADLSHEVRSPLNAIIGFSELLSDGAFGELNEEQTGAVGDILHAGHHLLQLINDVLDISRLATGRIELQLEVLCVASVVEQSLTVARALGLERGIRFEQDIEPDLAVWADERRVNQVLYNLLSNAIKHSAPGGKVVIRARGDADNAVVSVSDHGCGIRLEDQGRIFEDFVALPSENGAAGTGLGLSVTRRLVEAMGGMISVESSPGQGATFTFGLPRREAPNSPQA